MTINTDKQTEYLPIRELSKITSINSVTIRAWERRYGLLKPMRTDKGHRLYTQADAELIHNIQRWLDKGIAIGKIKPLLASKQLASAHSDDEWGNHIQTVSVAIETLNSKKLDALLRDILGNYPAKVVWKYLVKPVSEKYNALNNSFGLKSKQLLWYETIRDKTLQYIASQGQESDSEILIIGFGDQFLTVESLFLAREISESGIKPNIKFFSIPEKEVLFVAEQLDTDLLLLFCEKSLNQQSLKNLQSIVSNLTMPILLTGASSILNEKDLLTLDIEPFSDNALLIQHLKGVFLHD